MTTWARAALACLVFFVAGILVGAWSNSPRTIHCRTYITPSTTTAEVCA